MQGENEDGIKTESRALFWSEPLLLRKPWKKEAFILSTFN